MAKVISEIVKLIPADLKTHILDTYYILLHYLHHQVILTHAKVSYFNGNMVKRGQKHSQIVKTELCMAKLHFKITKTHFQNAKTYFGKAKTHFGGNLL